MAVWDQLFGASVVTRAQNIRRGLLPGGVVNGHPFIWLPTNQLKDDVRFRRHRYIEDVRSNWNMQYIDVRSQRYNVDSNDNLVQVISPTGIHYENDDIYRVHIPFRRRQSNRDRFMNLDVSRCRCTCRYYTRTNMPCKHIYAVQKYYRRSLNASRVRDQYELYRATSISSRIRGSRRRSFFDLMEDFRSILKF